jgi:ubiquinone/menaquinone biosynthesis C-methylase UbiE
MISGRLHALFLHRFSPRYNRLAADRKRLLFAHLSGRVLEIAAGSGANFDFLPPSIEWTGTDPNPHGARYCQQAARRHNIPAHWATAPAERLPFDDQSFAHVIATLALCSVSDPATALAEIHRVLVPGGGFLFLEHVAAPAGSPTLRRQRYLRPLFRCCFHCNPLLDTASLIAAAGFASVELDRFHLPIPIVGPHIAGRAVR